MHTPKVSHWQDCMILVSPSPSVRLSDSTVGDREVWLLGFKEKLKPAGAPSGVPCAVGVGNSDIEINVSFLSLPPKVEG